MPKKSLLELARECWAHVLAPDEPPKAVAEMVRLLCVSVAVPAEGYATLAGKLAYVAEQAGVPLDKADAEAAAGAPRLVHAPTLPQNVGNGAASSSNVSGSRGPTKRQYVDEIDKRTLNHNGGKKSRKVHTIGEKAHIIAAYDAVVAEQGGFGKGAKGKIEKDYFLGQGMLGRWLNNREQIKAAAGEERKKGRRCVASRGSPKGGPKESPRQSKDSRTTEAV